jgi:hypothetical protein
MGYSKLDFYEQHPDPKPEDCSFYWPDRCEALIIDERLRDGNEMCAECPHGQATESEGE